jgi:hypothetical protein
LQQNWLAKPKTISSRQILIQKKMKNQTSIKQDELLNLFEKFEQEEVILGAQMSNIFGGGTSQGDSCSGAGNNTADDCISDPPPSGTTNV